MTMFTLEQLQEAATLIYREMPATPQYLWPQICQQLGITVWVKHENHTPTGAFKIRGGITFMNWLRSSQQNLSGIITATRGNHGQSQARAALAAGIPAKIIVPKGNSIEKNNAMAAFGAEVIEFGDDFDSARLEALRLMESENLFMVPPFHHELIRGVSTCTMELLTAVPDVDVLYVPIGCGSGICSAITARDILGLKTEIIGVVSTEAESVKLSFEAGRLIETATANTFADGLAVRVPVAEAFEIYSKGASYILSVSEDEIANAMRLYFATTHNVVEGAGAATLAALIQDKANIKGKKAAVILTGGNIDTQMFASVLQGHTPKVI